MRRLLKFLHTLGAAGLVGGAIAMAVLLVLAPGSTGSGGARPLVETLAALAGWIVAPSMVVTVIAGLLAMAATSGFHEAGWVWAKAATGLFLLEGGLLALGPIQDEAESGAAAADPAALAHLFSAERVTVGLLLAVAVANIALAVWRPRFTRSRS